MDISPDFEDLKCGFRYDEAKELFLCLYCNASFLQGMIYAVADGSAEARKAAALHVAIVHGGAFQALLATKSAGLPAVQEKVLRLLHEGKSDAQIAESLGGKSASTVRNHRFALRKRETESRAFLALITLLDHDRPETQRFVQYPSQIVAQDERVVVSESEAKSVESRFLEGDGRGGLLLTGWPKKQKDKLVLLKRIATLFEREKKYTEKEVNAILRPLWSDHVTIRRYLIEYRFLDRTSDCSQYWVP